MTTEPITKEETTLKNYEVTVRACSVVFVGSAESQEQAFEIARDELDLSDFYDVEMSAEELKTPEDAERSERHADRVSKPLPGENIA